MELKIYVYVLKKMFVDNLNNKIYFNVKRLLENINDWKNAPVWTPKTIEFATKEWFKILSKN
tara:strand:- start:99 stop:284 length:186 start_codon:yes stop_codon:yes gene_type:complete